ncbi:MAG TPA: hypothetical protein VIL42_09240 [Sphingomicrobium sp.]|jgi:hypothetical protein
MEQQRYEPFPDGVPPRAFATPHSAPVAWLKSGPPAAPPPTPAEALEAAIALVLDNPEAVAEVLTRARTIPARHDGWTGERIAAFLEALSSTGMVTEACRAAGMHRDSAYALRDRDPVFAAAMAAALARSRSVVADGLLERSITGTVEHYYRDGVLVGERRHYESWLGLAVLKRLDKQAADDRADGALSAEIAGDWHHMLDAFRSGGSAAASALLEAKTDEPDTPPSPPGLDMADRCWLDAAGKWITTFPPPSGFTGYEKGTCDGSVYYERACTEEECALLDGHEAAMDAQLVREDAAHRDAYFASLKRDIDAANRSRTGC